MKKLASVASIFICLVFASASHGSDEQLTMQTMASNAANQLATHASIPAAGVSLATCSTKTSASAGTPRVDSEGSLADDPLFNIGSNAKSMLAVAAARLMEQGKLTFETTIHESGAFDIINAEHPFADVTLEELFSHTSGIATFHTGAALNTVETTGTPSRQRRQFAELALNAKPAGNRGEAAYSNAGIAVAGVILEYIAGVDTLRLLAQELFAPLQLNTAIVGDAGSLTNQQPLGHIETESGMIEPYTDTSPAIPPFLQSAGYVSISANDYATYLQMHLCGMQGVENTFLKADTIQKLNQAVSDSPYALGWAKTAFAGEQASFHIGGTGAFLAFAVIMPEADKAIGIMINSGSSQARTAAIEMIRKIANSD